MTTQEQAYISGFLKRAMEYGYSEEDGLELCKKAIDMGNIGRNIGKVLGGAAGGLVAMSPVGLIGGAMLGKTPMDAVRYGSNLIGNLAGKSWSTVGNALTNPFSRNTPSQTPAPAPNQTSAQKYSQPYLGTGKIPAAPNQRLM